MVLYCMYSISLHCFSTFVSYWLAVHGLRVYSAEQEHEVAHLKISLISCVDFDAMVNLVDETSLNLFHLPSRLLEWHESLAPNMMWTSRFQEFVKASASGVLDLSMQIDSINKIELPGRNCGQCSPFNCNIKAPAVSLQFPFINWGNNQIMIPKPVIKS